MKALAKLAAVQRDVADQLVAVDGRDIGTVICPEAEVKLYVTGDLAFQAMAFGKESMLGHWCMQCTMQMQCTLTLDQMNAVKMWTMEELCRLGDQAEQ